MPWWIGTYDVIVDGKLVFSKSKFGRFPAPGEVTGMVKGLQERAADSTTESGRFSTINNRLFCSIDYCLQYLQQDNPLDKSYKQ